jgi:hypothetical protein
MRYAQNASANRASDPTSGATTATLDRVAKRDDADARTATTATQWVSVAVAARLVGVSPRAIQRRCQSEKYNARLVRAPKGEVWEVDSATLETSATGTATTATLDRDDADAKRDDRDAQRDAQPQNIPAGVSQWKEREGELREEIRFLRNVVEAQQRDAAELRQSLKKALEIAPRQLTAGNAPAQSDDQGARIEASGPQNRGGRGRDGGDQNAPNRGGAVTYASIADELENTLGVDQ